jgi:hypothetical protein
VHVSALLQPGSTRAHAEAVEEEPEEICEYCGYPAELEEFVNTAKGKMHCSCAERVFPVDHGDSRWAS